MIRRGLGGRYSGPVGSEADPWGETWSQASDIHPPVMHVCVPAIPAAGRPTAGDVMTTDVRSCRETDTLASAALTMSRGDCRFLPVLDEDHRPIGVITDGDICLLGATDYRPLRDVYVSEAMSKPAITCRPDKDIGEVLSLMRSRRVRHLPVVGEEGVIVGLISLTDLVLAVEQGAAHRDPLCGQLASTLREVCQNRTPGFRAPDSRFIAD